jgi:hypothetical protein
MIVDDTTINWLTLYTPNSTGTIISPDHYIMDNGHVDEFLQSGTRNGKGYLQFKSANSKTMAKVKMKRQRNGLWYTDSPVLLPPLPDGSESPTKPKVHQTTAHEDNKSELPTPSPSSICTTMWTAQASQAIKHLKL